MSGEDNGEEAFACPEDGCDFTSASERGVKIHHTRRHGSDSISKDDLLNELSRVADRLGKTPTLAEMVEHGEYSRTKCQNMFGTWNKAIGAAGLEPNRAHVVSGDDCVVALRELTDKVGRTPTYNEMNEHGGVSARICEIRFNSWNNALAAADLSLNKEHGLSDEELLTALKDLADDLGRSPRYDEMDIVGRFGTTVYLDRFGSWNAALDEAGLNITQRHDMTNQELLDEIHRLAEWLGTVPTREKMRSSGCFSTNVYETRFGSWDAAITEAGYPVYDERRLPLVPEHRRYCGIWHTNRQRCRERDRFRCLSCGMTEERHKQKCGNELSVHHITPVSKFINNDGTFDAEQAHALENLRTLCISCHRKWEGLPIAPEIV